MGQRSNKTSFVVLRDLESTRDHVVEALRKKLGKNYSTMHPAYFALVEPLNDEITSQRVKGKPPPERDPEIGDLFEVLTTIRLINTLLPKKDTQVQLDPGNTVSVMHLECDDDPDACFLTLITSCGLVRTTLRELSLRIKTGKILLVGTRNGPL